jgi:hypothetical protein
MKFVSMGCIASFGLDWQANNQIDKNKNKPLGI